MVRSSLARFARTHGDLHSPSTTIASSPSCLPTGNSCAPGSQPDGLSEERRGRDAAISHRERTTVSRAQLRACERVHMCAAERVCTRERMRSWARVHARTHAQLRAREAELQTGPEATPAPRDALSLKITETDLPARAPTPPRATQVHWLKSSRTRDTQRSLLTRSART